MDWYADRFLLRKQSHCLPIHHQLILLPCHTIHPYILVKSSEQAIKDIAEYYRSLFYNIEVVGITGSVGKTSTKEMIASVLSCEYAVHKTQGNSEREPHHYPRIRKSRQQAARCERQQHTYPYIRACQHRHHEVCKRILIHESDLRGCTVGSPGIVVSEHFCLSFILYAVYYTCICAF